MPTALQFELMTDNMTTSCLPANNSVSYKRKFVIEDVITKNFEEAEPCLVTFPHGKLKSDSSITGTLLYNSNINQTKGQKQRMLKINAQNHTYTGKDFGEDFKQRLFLGVLNKSTNKMKLVEMSAFLVHADVKVKNIVESKKNDKELSFIDKQSALLENFGVKRSKTLIRKKLEQERANKNEMSSALDSALKSVKIAEDEEIKTDIYSHVLPLNNRKTATKVSEVYPIENIITDEELSYLNSEAMNWISTDEENFLSALFKHTLSKAQSIRNEEEQARIVCMALYVEYLIILLNTKFKNKPDFENCPYVIKRKIMNTFTEGVPRKASKMEEDKIIATILILSLTANNFTLPFTIVCQGLRIKDDRLTSVIRVVGATLVAHQTVVLKLPLKEPVSKSKKARR